MTKEALRLHGVRKVHGTEENQVVALDGVTLSLSAGTFTAVMGPSGSGKSTLLQVAAGLDRPTAGEVFVDGHEMAGDETALTKFRRDRVGFVFQQFNLIPTVDVLANVLLPAKLAGKKPEVERAQDILGRVGLGDRIHRYPHELSGGQQQRVAIARALVTSPAVLFADEPTGALDTRSARAVLGLLQEAVRGYGQTLVMVTHDPVAASYADAVVFLADGRIVGRMISPTVDAVAERLAHLGDDLVRD